MKNTLLLLIYLSKSITLKRDKSISQTTSLSQATIFSQATTFSNSIHFSTCAPISSVAPVSSVAPNSKDAISKDAPYSKRWCKNKKSDIKFLMPFFYFASHFYTIFYSRIKGYIPHSRYLKISTLIIGFTIITYLLKLSFLHCCILVLFITIMLCILAIMREHPYQFHLPYILFLWVLVTVIGVSSLISLAITNEFQINFENLSEIDIFLLYLGTARIIIDISLTNNKRNFFDRIKSLLKEYWPCLKENPLFCISVGISLYLLVSICINFYCWCMGLSLCTQSLFTFYLFMLTKVILVNSTISLLIWILIPSKEWYNIIGMSIWLPVVLIPSSLFYFIYILPELIKIKLALIDIIQIKLIKLEQGWFEFKLGIIYIVDGMKFILNHLNKGWFYLEPLFFLSIRNLGEFLISINNRPAQLGRFLLEWANWGLDRKKYSLTRKQFMPADYTPKSFGHLWSKIQYNLARNKDNFRFWMYVKSKPRFLPVVFPISVSNKGSNSHLLSGSLKSLFTAVYFYINNNLNLIKLYNTMETLGSHNYYLPIIIEDCTVVVNLSMNSLNFILSYKGKEAIIAFGADIIAKNIWSYNGDLNKDNLNLISHRDRLLDLTNPSRLGYNPQVLMQRHLNYDNANFTHDESSIVPSTGEPSNLNRGIKRTRGDIENEIAETYDQDIGFKIEYVNERLVAYLKFDPEKLSPFTRNIDDTSWRDYLEAICTDLRQVFIEAAGPEMAETVTMDNIILDCDNRKRRYHEIILGCAIITATGHNDIDFDWKNFTFLKKDFIECLEFGEKYNEYIKTLYAENSDSEKIETTEYSNNNNYNEKLSKDEIDSLIGDLKTRQSNIKSGPNNRLRDLRIFLNRPWKPIEVLMEDGTSKEIHPLLTRLHQTNKDCFGKDKNGNAAIRETTVSSLISKLEYLKLYGDDFLKDSPFSTPLADDEIDSLIGDLKTRQSNIKSGSKSQLKHLRISLNKSCKTMEVLMENGTAKEIHFLLTRLYQTNKDCFDKDNRGSFMIRDTRILSLISNLEGLKSTHFNEQY